MFIEHIPKGIIEKIRKKCFSLLWVGKRENEGIPLVKWVRVEKLKESRGGA
jgi:hypothetical protein